MKKILVTGSAGFIGFHLVGRLLSLGHNVVGLDNMNDYYDPLLKQARNNILLKHKNYSFYKGDISNFDFLEKVLNVHKDIHRICNLAAQAGVRYSLLNPFVYEDSNVKGFLNILEIAKKYNIKSLIFASSSSVYGDSEMPVNGFSEDMDLKDPISVYAATKLADELFAYTYHHLYGINVTGLRFFTVYGSWGRPDMAYYSFTKKILQGETIELYNFGQMKRDFTYIDDIVDGIIAAIERDYKFEIFNLGNSCSVELRYFLACLEKFLGKKAKIKLSDLQPGDLVETYANIEKAKKMLNFSPNTKIEDGLMVFTRWYKEYYKV